MAGYLQMARALWSLGLASVARVAWYRISLKTGLSNVKRLRPAPIVPPFFHPSTLSPTGLPTTDRWQDEAFLFGWAEFDLGGQPPRWHTNLFNSTSVEDPALPWWKIPDFDPALGDIKTIWELSRFDWVLANAQRAREGCEESLERLNKWLIDWNAANPSYLGPNWKCGQEASIRVLHLAVAAQLLGQVGDPSAGLRALVRNHLLRIAPTIGYAIGQNNNHGTSEAAALFVGGTWLAINGDRQGRKWARIGRKVLENRVSALISDDGSFSQYSLVYHRLMLDTLSVVEVWRRTMRLPEFSARYQSRARSATLWLHSFVNSETGAVPNLGANDGARLIPLTDTPTSDFRPSLQLSSVLHLNARATRSDQSSDMLALWLDVALPEATLPTPDSIISRNGGFAALHCSGASAFLRFPVFAFRPCQADALHLDIWYQGKGLLRDAGSYSYAAGPKATAYFSGTAGHNTIMFDSREQMPRIGRFLFSDWLKCNFISQVEITESTQHFSVGYKSRTGSAHHREIKLSEHSILINDSISGFVNKAVMRWRLPVGEWVLNNQTATMKGYKLEISGTMHINDIRIVIGEESLNYYHRSKAPVLEIEVHADGVLGTTFSWSKSGQ
jgi:hypothetical protein